MNSFNLGKSFLDTCPHTVHFYKNHVEQPMLEATQKYYEAKSKDPETAIRRCWNDEIHSGSLGNLGHS